MPGPEQPALAVATDVSVRPAAAPDAGPTSAATDVSVRRAATPGDGGTNYQVMFRAPSCEGEPR